MFEYTFAEYSQQSAAQPLAMTIWLRWLLLINFLPALIFIKQLQARWVLAALIAMLAMNTPLGLMYGFSKVLALPHILVWVPLLIYLAQEWRAQRLLPSVLFRTWIGLVMATNLISLVFDVRDGFQFLLGDRTIVMADPASIPYFSLGAIAIVLAGLFAYIHRGANQQG